VQGSESPLMRLSPGEIAELQKLLEGIASMHRPAEEEREAADAPPPVEREAVRQDPPAAAIELPDYNDLESEEIIALLGSLERLELEALRELEEGSRARQSVLHAIDSVLARAPAAS
jgi:hypothetical protein